MKKAFFCLTIFALTIMLHGQTTKEFKVDSILNQYFPDGFNGNILFASNDSVIFKKSYGYKDLKAKDPLNDSTVFELASCSKQFTALAILKLYELGKLSVQDSLRKFFPQLPYHGITLYHLITHTSGLTIDQISVVQKSKTECCSNIDFINTLAKVKPALRFKPGDKWEYCSTGYIILASVVEKVSGQTFEDFMKYNFFVPLKMTHTRIYNSLYTRHDTLKNYAYAHIKTKGTYSKPYDLFAYKRWTKKLSCLVGTIGVNTSALDLIKWDNGLRNYKVLSNESLKLAYDSVKLNNGKKASYGFGYNLYADKEVGRVVIHTGEMRGYQSLIYRLIDVNKILIILNNKVSSENQIIKAGNKIDMLLSGAYKNSS